MKKTDTKTEVTIKPPNMETTVIEIEGMSPLVIHRFSVKAKNMMLDKMRAGSQAKKGTKRDAMRMGATSLNRKFRFAGFTQKVKRK